MIEPKGILIFYPHNLRGRKSGIDNRYLNLLKYFKSRGVEVDVFTLSGPQKKETKIHGLDLVSEIFVYRERKYPLTMLLRKIFLKVRKKIHSIDYFSLPDLASGDLKKAFRQQALNKKYDFILISYIQWARIVDDPCFDKYIKILDLSDFTTHQLYEKSKGKIRTGTVFSEEVNRVNLFDMVMAVSEKEHYLFSQFCDHPRFYSVPIFISEGKAGSGKHDIDLLIIGSGNPHNVRGVEWFFDHVIKLLPENVKIAVAGEISNFVPESNQVIKFGYQDDLSSLYHRSRIALSPLLSGSGMKVKVVEALSYGLPVVATGFGSAGIDGTEKNGLFISDDPAGFAEAVEKLLTEEELYKRSSVSALRFFRENFSSEIVYKQLDSIFLQ